MSVVKGQLRRKNLTPNTSSAHTVSRSRQIEHNINTSANHNQLSVHRFHQRNHSLFGNMWSSIRRPGQFSRKGNVAPKTSATSVAATSAMQAVLSGADGYKSSYSSITNGFGRISRCVTDDANVSAPDNIPLHPLLLDGSSGRQTSRVFNSNDHKR
ncbi:uncharacterized protein LOC129720826 isoform X2 [Wyeomyia smithii]|uniref:uncharacterized protein LOC129720826 isoform X2 n=1 Tax=Wyeomyia smithii TaxID=174621 RepID=UPI002467EAC6|nr:uncharacterized protein LOC129720826 isoform X2 [Wyeomyia smithii]